MDRYKSFFRGIAYAGYCIVFLFAVYTFEKSIPDQIYVKAGEAIDYRFQVPVTMEIQEDNSPVAKSTNNANVRQSYIVTCRLFGIFPVKDIEVVLVDGDAVYAGGMPIGIYVKTSGVLVIGTSEVEMVLASQCILQSRPKTMRITVDGELGKGVTAKDVALYMMSKMTTSGATGYFVEYAGSAIRNLTMEGRLTLCNLSIEMGARGGMVAPDEVTFEYIKGRENAPQGEAWDQAMEYWKTLKSDDDAVFDQEVRFDAADIEPMITYGTNPGMGMGITQNIPTTEGMGEAAQVSFKKSMEYMGFQPGESLLGKKIDYVFLGACTNGRIEDFRAFASLVKGRRKADNVIAWLVPGSWMVDAQIRKEGIDKILTEAGFAIRQPGCSACLAMNDDKIPAGKYSVSTSNRNFEGRQGPGSRTLLASPLVAAAAAVTGVITDPRELM